MIGSFLVLSSPFRGAIEDLHLDMRGGEEKFVTVFLF
jgi:hypothetical protein